jgi:hypothetical protein
MIYSPFNQSKPGLAIEILWFFAVSSGIGREGNPKAEIRNPKSERSPKPETQNPSRSAFEKRERSPTSAGEVSFHL